LYRGVWCYCIGEGRVVPVGEGRVAFRDVRLLRASVEPKKESKFTFAVGWLYFQLNGVPSFIFLCLPSNRGG
jgi:hypothetical protein